MEGTQEAVINEDAVRLAIIEIKLCINQRLFTKGALTEEMYTRAKDLIMKDDGKGTYERQGLEIFEFPQN